MDNIIEIKNLIYFIRNHKVMLDSDLAKLYGVETKILNQAVKRNISRFPEDFMFKITKEEWENLRSQFVTSRDCEIRGGRRYLPNVFTQHGVLMLANVLRSKKAIDTSIQIIRVFEQLRQFALENKELTVRLEQIEHYVISHVKNDRAEFQKIYKILDLLMDRTKPCKIGFIKE